MDRDVGRPVAARRIDSIFRFATLVELPDTAETVVGDIQIAFVVDGDPVRTGATR